MVKARYFIHLGGETLNISIVNVDRTIFSKSILKDDYLSLSIIRKHISRRLFIFLFIVRL